MSSHVISKKSARIEFVALLVVSAAIVMGRYVLGSHYALELGSKYVLWTGIATIILYVPRFWFKEYVSDLRERHHILTWSALCCIAIFILLDLLDLRMVYLIVWGIFAMSILVSAISAFRRPRLPPPPQPRDVAVPPSNGEPKEQKARGDTSIRGDKIYQEQIRSIVEPKEKGKFVAIDIETGDYEIDVRDAVATRRLLKRNPQAITYAKRVGHPTAYRIRRMS